VLSLWVDLCLTSMYIPLAAGVITLSILFRLRSYVSLNPLVVSGVIGDRGAQGAAAGPGGRAGPPVQGRTGARGGRQGGEGRGGREGRGGDGREGKDGMDGGRRDGWNRMVSSIVGVRSRMDHPRPEEGLAFGLYWLGRWGLVCGGGCVVWRLSAVGSWCVRC
jgi:hypothetical protein